MNPIKRLRKQMDKLQVVSPTRTFVNMHYTANQASESTAGSSIEQDRAECGPSNFQAFACQPF
jgi:hypothetical protein